MAPRPFKRRRVVVTGRGCVTPLGGNVSSTWDAAAAGRSGVGETTRVDADGPADTRGRVKRLLNEGNLGEARKILVTLWDLYPGKRKEVGRPLAYSEVLLGDRAARDEPD